MAGAPPPHAMGDADVGDPVKAEATLEECVRLLSSDSRERKFVGMLLVTRLIPDADDDATLTRVYGATGFAQFITSMLRAAPSSASACAGDVGDADERAVARAAQATASHALALATCAALSKSPEVATDPSMVERLPLFAAAMARKGRYAALPSSAVADACEAVTRVVTCGGESAAAVAADTGAVAAAAAAVVAAAAASADADPERAAPLLNATRLLATLLESPAACERVHGAEDPDETEPKRIGSDAPGDAVFGIPDAAAGGGGGGEASAPHPPPKKNKKKDSKTARAVARAAPSLAATFASLPGVPEHIEALRCLSSILSALPARRPSGRLASELAEVALLGDTDFASSTSGTDPGTSRFWLDDVRGGVAAALRSKAPREIKHAALDVCAACVDLVGPRWLCRDAFGAAAEAVTSVKSFSFFRFVSELVRVETAVLLHDLTRDDHALRADARRMLAVPLVVYERLVSALAEDVEAAEVSETSPAAAARVPGARLSAETATICAGTLAAAAGSLLDFLEHRAEHSGSSSLERFTSLEKPTRGDGADADDADADAADAADADVSSVLAVTRALGCFLAELPEPHAARVDALLPFLFATRRDPSRGLEPIAVLSPFAASPATRALAIRFTLPYALQSTETPSGLDAFADAEGPEALGFLILRTVHAVPESLLDRREARGVCAACVAGLRNAAEGASRGFTRECLGAAVVRVFSEVSPSLERWATEALERLGTDVREEQKADPEGIAFLRRVSRTLRASSPDSPASAMSVAECLRVTTVLVPAGLRLGEGSGMGGGGFLFGDGVSENGGDAGGKGLDEPIEL